MPAGGGVAATATGGFRLAAETPFQREEFGRLRIVCDPSATEARRLLMLEGIFDPGFGDPFHYHPDQEEIMYVVEGRVEQWLGEERRILGPGDATLAMPGQVHGAWNVGDRPARLFAIFGPCVEGGIGRVDVADAEPWRTLRG
jgi:quercetin dioxygenase-like cupin family protein